MSKPDISIQIRIQPNPDYWYTIEDFDFDRGDDGLTISYWHVEEGEEKRINHICIEKNSTPAIVSAIQQLATIFANVKKEES